MKRTELNRFWDALYNAWLQRRKRNKTKVKKKWHFTIELPAM
jgi:hypothetical protein